MASSMAADVEERIRALPGSGTCADCSNLSPQWASVTYGALVCLDCSGQHRSLGVHLSFVRSIQMDAWTEKQISAMDKAGGNQSLVDYLKSKGIDQNMQIAQKYNTPQAAYYKDQLSRWLEGKTEPPPDPGNYDPTTGGGDAQGAEPLPGESTEDYNDRQARLREQARERLRAKFGEGGMGGQGSPEASAGPDVGAAVGAAAAATKDVAGKAAGAMGTALTGSIGFLKSNVIENTDLHTNMKSTAAGAVDSVKGAASGVTEKATGMWGSLRQSVADGELVNNIKKNATAEEGSMVKKGFGWGMGAATSLWSKASESVGDVLSGTQKPCTGEHQLTVDPRTDVKCELCNFKGTRYACSRGCEYFICPKCFEKPPPAKPGNTGAGGFEDDDFFDEDEAKEPPPEATADDMARIAKELGMDIGGAKDQPEAEAPVAEPKPEPKPKAKPAEPEDFFADFGV